MTSEEFGPYRLVELLGRGGMGEVYLAHDTRRDRAVALKRLPAEFAANPEFRARFRNESALVAKLNEPHIIPIHDYGEIDGTLFIDMRLVDGVDLGALLRAGPLPPRRAVEIVGQVADALDAAHAAGLVHRDIKPSNVLLVGAEGTVSSSGNIFAYLVDFGIARTLEGTGISRVGLPVGTVAYMAPERLQEHPWDHRVDIYALACLLFECLTGERPFPADNIALAVLAHINKPRPRPSAVRPSLGTAFDDVIARGMAQDPNARYPSAGALAVDAARRAAQATVPVPWSDHSPTRERPPQPARGPERQMGHPLPTPGSHPVLPPPARRPQPSPRPVPSPGPAQGRTHRSVASVAPGVPSRAAPVAGGRGPAAPAEPSRQMPSAEHPSGPIAAPRQSVLSGRRWLLLALASALLIVLAVVIGQLTAAPPHLAVGPGAVAVVAGPDGSTLYVPDPAAGQVSVIRASGMTAEKPISVPGQPVAVAEDGSRLYVAQQGEGTVTTIDPATGTAIGAPIGVGPRPVALAAVPGRGTPTRLVVAHDDGAVSIVDSGSGARRSTTVGGTPTAVAVAPDGTRAWVAQTDPSGGAVVVIDLAAGTVAARIPVGRSPDALAALRDGRRVYVANQDDGTVSVIETASLSVVRTVEVGASPSGVAVTGTLSRGRVYVTNRADATLSVIDTVTNGPVGDPRAVGGGPVGVAVAAGGSVVAVLEQGSGTVSAYPT